MPLNDGGRQEDFPGGHSRGAIIHRQETVQESGSGPEIPDNEDRLFNILLPEIWVKKFIQSVCESDAVMPDGIGDENEGDNEETFESEPSRRVFGFEKAVVDRFKEQLEIWHNSLIIPSVRGHETWELMDDLLGLLYLITNIPELSLCNNFVKSL